MFVVVSGELFIRLELEIGRVEFKAINADVADVDGEIGAGFVGDYRVVGAVRVELHVGVARIGVVRHTIADGQVGDDLCAVEVNVNRAERIVSGVLPGVMPCEQRVCASGKVADGQFNPCSGGGGRADDISLIERLDGDTVVDEFGRGNAGRIPIRCQLRAHRTYAGKSECDSAEGVAD